MSFLNMLLGSDNKLESRDIAQDMIKDSKFRVTSLAVAAAEAVNRGLRQIIGQQLDKAVSEHFELTDIRIRKGWYPAYDKPVEQIKKEYEKSQKLT
ncbi:MAG: spore coat protein [Clostridiaceae bacterium]